MTDAAGPPAILRDGPSASGERPGGIIPLLLVGALLLALIWGAVSLEITRMRRERMETFQSHLRHLSAMMETSLERQFQAIDNALQMLRHVSLEYPQEIPHLLHILHTGPLEGLDAHIALTGPDGVAREAEPAAGAGVNHADTRPFRFFSAGGHDQFMISEQIPTAAGASPRLLFARPLLDAKYRFRGLAQIALPPEELTRFARAYAGDHDMVLTVVSPGGVMLSRSKGLGQAFGLPVPADQMEELRRRDHGYTTLTSSVDRQERGVAFAWLSSYPIVMGVSETTAGVKADIRHDRDVAIATGAGASAVVLLALGLLGRAQGRARRYERLLQREHDHLGEAQHVANIGSWELDHREDKLYWSDEVYRMFETDPTRSPATYAGFLERVHPADRLGLERTFRASVTSGTPYAVEHRLLLPDGRVKWVRERCHTLYESDGRPLRSVGTVQDITAQKQQDAERETLAREKMLLLESTGEGIIGIDYQGHCTFVNPAACQMLGYSADELVGHKVHALVHYQHADGRPFPDSECPVYETHRTGISHRVDHDVFWRKDGSALPVEYSAHPMREGTRITGSVTVFSDISARLRAEAELRIAATAFETQEGMFVTDAAGTILRVNRAFTEITGYSAAEAVGQNPRFRSSGRHEPAFYQHMWSRIRQFGFWKGECWNRHKNGQVYPESLSITAVRGDDGAITHYVATLHDISERKAAEEHIRSLAFYDPLTQLPNRRLLLDRLQQAELASVRTHRRGAVLFIDLDRFKLLNDTYGHDMGDLLLRQVAHRLQECVRQVDTVARLGGDEFVVLLCELDEEGTQAHQEADAVGRKLLDALNRPYDLNGLVYHSTPSIGITLFDGDAVDADELLRQADQAMYQAKQGGRNALRFFEADTIGAA